MKFPRIEEVTAIKKPVIRNIRNVCSHRTGSLPCHVSIDEISAALPGIKNIGRSVDGKSTAEWRFSVDGFQCAIWDYKGARWSTFGPAAAFEAIGLPIIRD